MVERFGPFNHASQPTRISFSMKSWSAWAEHSPRRSMSPGVRGDTDSVEPGAVFRRADGGFDELDLSRITRAIQNSGGQDTMRPFPLRFPHP